MAIRDLRDKYGKNLKGRQAVNAAIRAEFVGGDDLLDAMDLVDRLTRRIKDHNVAGAWEAEQALCHLRRLRELMAGVVASRYNLGATDAT